MSTKEEVLRAITAMDTPEQMRKTADLIMMYKAKATPEDGHDIDMALEARIDEFFRSAEQTLTRIREQLAVMEEV
ncbi:hypothetical protein GCM10023187_21160 [Nibrella viscosa]|uniref:Uncharacterized protein n=1 Tax=Nibrella viscosa TaxID=1084524 RepID=A0ABP8KD16_9BACT